jgi:hypothetical protein
MHSGWGTKFEDFDNDGWKDLFVGQGHVMDNIQISLPQVRYLEAPLLMRNVSRGKFVDVSTSAGPGFQKVLATRGVAFGDLNNDGWVDVVMNCNNQPAVLLENRPIAGNHWLTVNTQGTTSNRDGIGARIRLVPESGSPQYAMVSTGGSYLSSSDKRVHFGLGASRRVKSLEVSWPSGKVQRLENLMADRFITVREP